MCAAHHHHPRRHLKQSRVDLHARARLLVASNQQHLAHALDEVVENGPYLTEDGGQDDCLASKRTVAADLRAECVDERFWRGSDTRGRDQL